MSAYKLIIFDVDGTLSTPDSGKLRSDAKPYFKNLKSAYPEGGGPKIALVANQGGVGLRYWMETNGFGEPKEYPTQKKAEGHINGVAKEIEKLYEKPDIYISFAYQSRKGEWAPTPKDKRSDPRWRRNWRKPEPGMLLAAMKAAGVKPEETLMVSDDGPETAQNAGCDHMWDHEFFQREPETRQRKARTSSNGGGRGMVYLIGATVVLTACCFFAFVFRPNVSQEFDEITTEVAVKNDTAKSSSLTSLPPTEESTAESKFMLSPSEEAYFNKVMASGGDIAEALTNLGELAKTPRIGEDDWTVDVALQLATIRTSHKELLQMNVPDGLESFHDYLTDATGDCNEATDHFAAGVDNFDNAELEIGLNSLKSCGDKIKMFEREFNKGIEALK